MSLNRRGPDSTGNSEIAVIVRRQNCRRVVNQQMGRTENLVQQKKYVLASYIQTDQPQSGTLFDEATLLYQSEFSV